MIWFATTEFRVGNWNELRNKMIALLRSSQRPQFFQGLKIELANFHKF